MEALNYESFIRGVFKSGRTLANGADADIYRRMSLCHREIEVKSMLKSEHEREVDFQMAFVPVRNNIYHAILTLKGQLSNKASKEHEALLTGYLSELNMRFYRKERLDEIIAVASDIHYLCQK